MASALESLIQAGITIASDTAEYKQIAVYHPTDATSNPSLVLAAVRQPEYSHLIDDAIHYAYHRLPVGSVEERAELAMDRLLVQVGVEILNIIPGRVSVSVDPRLAYDHDAIVAKGQSLVSLFEELSILRERILIKIPATYPGILAARNLANQPQPIHANMTLIFGRVQSLACAQAGISVISPFVGRVKDWFAAHPEAASAVPSEMLAPTLSQHPGLRLVQQIRAMYRAHNYCTEIMAAGFRHVDEIIELGKSGQAGGPDLVTLPPSLLEDLRLREPFSTQPGEEAGGNVEPEPIYVPAWGSEDVPDAKELYEDDLVREAVAADKVPEGLEKFAADARILEGIIRLIVGEPKKANKSRLGS